MPHLVVIRVIEGLNCVCSLLRQVVFSCVPQVVLAASWVRLKGLFSRWVTRWVALGTIRTSFRVLVGSLMARPNLSLWCVTDSISLGGRCRLVLLSLASGKQVVGQTLFPVVVVPVRCSVL